MVIYRLANSLYKDDLSGQGAYLFGGRWNSKSVYALYGAQHISLAVLEIVVNFDRQLSPLVPSFHLLELQVPDSSVISLDAPALKKSWQDDMGYTQFIGDQFLQEQSHLVLQVPSAVIPEESNFLINPKHTLFKQVRVENSRSYPLDRRLF
ncbi:MAG: RES family NAD+ phosphorylase [Niabella sp.]